MYIYIYIYIPNTVYMNLFIKGIKHRSFINLQANSN